jgi:hypothetical protein
LLAIPVIVVNMGVALSSPRFPSKSASTLRRSCHQQRFASDEEETMNHPVLPRVQAMVLCDTIEESDDEIGVYHLTGVRSVLHVPAFPAFQPRLSVFVQMSGHRGEASFRIGIRQALTDDVIYQTKAKTIAFHEPTLIVPVVFRLRNCTFPAAGLYYAEILHDEKLVGERRLQLRQQE